MTQIALNIDEKPKTKQPACRQGVASKNRSVTDGYWCFFFLFIVTVWLLARYYAYHENRRPPNVNVDHDNNTIAVNNTTVYEYLSGKHWLIDLFTCNLSHMSANFESSGWIVIYANIIFSLGLAAYSIASMRKDDKYEAQFEVALNVLIVTSTWTRKDVLMENRTSSRSLSDELITPYHPMLKYWFMPELVFLAIFFSKISLKRLLNRKLANDASALFMMSGMYIMLWMLILLSILYINMMPLVFESGWDRPLSYVILIGNLYFGLTCFYYVLMTLSCSKDVAEDCCMECPSESDIMLNSIFVIPYRSFLLVLRYHFGTACYHATLIFPRLTALFVMNEPEFKRTPTIKKLAVIQGKLHDITPTFTGVDGTNYSDSLRQLLRDWPTRNSPNLQYFQGFRRITLTIFGLLMSTNNLMIITLWFYGVDDPKLALATWAYYLRTMIIFNLLTRFVDTMWDAFSLNLNLPVNFCSEKFKLCRNCKECTFPVEECTFCTDYPNNSNENRGEKSENETSKT